ncbi:hypothetical protein EZV62_020465 [Acer yangbiense]|uniref:O-methyltransferase dimerisation domain-containing protein n=1 Tax=Acer yangbiense TaxID=1000413 RepID=A0A5C7HEE1_9ROSI|nr:hypothetical protein EZV62_020465 [Acer yangbiense]
MESVEEVDEEGLLLRGQAQVWQLMFGFADSMALKAAVELRLADIIHSYAGPLTLSQIASGFFLFPFSFLISVNIMNTSSIL